jgi:arylsulfatase
VDDRLPFAEVARVLHRVDESFNVGADTGTPVDDTDYQVPFPLHG